MPEKTYRIRGPKGGVAAPHAPARRLGRTVAKLVHRYGRVTVTANKPLSKPPRPRHEPQISKAEHVVAYCHAALGFAGRMVYTETAARSELFHRKPGDFGGAHADCSQFVSAILHWVGVEIVNDRDYTGTLLKKGELVKTPAPGRVAVWGPGTGAHAAFVTEKHGADWYVVGFGHQGAPDRNTLSGMNAYFERRGEPGVRFLEFV